MTKIGLAINIVTNNFPSHYKLLCSLPLFINLEKIMEQQLPKQLLPFFWHFVKPYKWRWLATLSTGLIWGIQTNLTPYFMKQIINALAYYEGNKAEIFNVIWVPVLCYFAVWFTQAINFRLLDVVKVKLYPNIRVDIINAMFAYLGRHSHAYLQNNFAGSLANKMMDMAGGTAAVLNKFDEAVANIFVFMIAMVSMSFVSPLFSGILLGWAFLFFSVTFMFSRKIKILSKVFSESKSVLAGKIVDAVTNLTNIRLFASNTYENDRLAKFGSGVANNDRDVQRYILKMRICWDVTFITLITSMLSALIFMYSKGRITVGDFTFIMTVSISIFMHMWQLASQFVQFAEEIGKCSQALTIITAPHEIVDSTDAKPLVVSKGEIIFDNVSFNYQRNNNLFQNKHVEIKAGEKIGLVGFSGSGKTTFVNLILRFFDVESGKILIDGQDIAKVTQDSLHQKISMIPQDTSLFHRSLMENIRYGRLDATDDEVIVASKKAHCHEFISILPEGYDALVGERGIKLSGGQRQRIAIARASLKNAPILILDEATSALDSVTEKHIQDGLHELMQNHATIVIAHRLSTLSEMDRILVFDKGHIIEDGSHEQLLEINGHYAKMWHMQAGGFLPESEEK
jgi:ATP-binding cassette subfamily B protein